MSWSEKIEKAMWGILVGGVLLCLVTAFIMLYVDLNKNTYGAATKLAAEYIGNLRLNSSTQKIIHSPSHPSYKP